MNSYKYFFFVLMVLVACNKNNSFVQLLSSNVTINLCDGNQQLESDVSILSFNRLNKTSLSSISEVIEVLDPDIIGLQESYDMGLIIADRFNYCFYGNQESSVAILSKYMIEGVNDIQAKIFLNDSLFFNFFNVHFTAYPYQPYDIRDTLITTSNQAVHQAEQTRGLEVTELVSLVDLTRIENNMPIVITGDFNEPSHLDWVLGAENPINFNFANSASQFVVNWPSSIKMTDSNLTDLYREFYPDPISKPGYTWTPNNSISEVHDRIDFIYYDSQKTLIPESVIVIGPDNHSDLKIDNYESDHRGVFSVFSLELN